MKKNQCLLYQLVLLQAWHMAVTLKLCLQASINTNMLFKPEPFDIAEKIIRKNEQHAAPIMNLLAAGESPSHCCLCHPAYCSWSWNNSMLLPTRFPAVLQFILVSLRHLFFLPHTSLSLFPPLYNSVVCESMRMICASFLCVYVWGMRTRGLQETRTPYQYL